MRNETVSVNEYPFYSKLKYSRFIVLALFFILLLLSVYGHFIRNQVNDYIPIATFAFVFLVLTLRSLTKVIITEQYVIFGFSPTMAIKKFERNDIRFWCAHNDDPQQGSKGERLYCFTEKGNFGISETEFRNYLKIKQTLTEGKKYDAAPLQIVFDKIWKLNGRFLLAFLIIIFVAFIIGGIMWAGILFLILIVLGITGYMIFILLNPHL